ncbi:MAG: hypothetical protein R3C05_12755 [Pirellulaceae bacterium]
MPISWSLRRGYPAVRQTTETWNAFALWPSFVPLIQEMVAVLQTPDEFSDEAPDSFSLTAAQETKGKAEAEPRYLPIADDRAQSSMPCLNGPTMPEFINSKLKVGRAVCTSLTLRSKRAI